jgi:xanthine dehydrogenase YagS FAD-binding subunit
MPSPEVIRVREVESAVALVTADPLAAYLAGGTTPVELMNHGVVAPRRLVDITSLPLRGVTDAREELRVGALTTLAELAADPAVAERLPMVGQALLAGGSPHAREGATVAGELLQRTACGYFRDPAVAACNKRVPGSGCAALRRATPMHAILGAGERCIAAHGSDLCVALAALDAAVYVQGVAGERRVPLTALHVAPTQHPDVEHVLAHGELITEIGVPLLPRGVPSAYVDVRDDASPRYPIASVAAALLMQDGVIAAARIALGGVATIPWRARPAEHALLGARPGLDAFTAAAAAALADPFVVEGTAFKVQLTRRLIVRALLDLSV